MQLMLKYYLWRDLLMHRISHAVAEHSGETPG